MRMVNISSLILETPDPAAAERFTTAAFGDGVPVAYRASDAPSSGFRGFHISLIVSQPSTVHALFDAAITAGARAIRPVARSMWGHGGTLEAPDGAIWKVATSAKKDTGAVTRAIDNVVLLIGAEDVPASKRFYVERGLTVGKSFGSYVDFDLGASPIGFGLYKRRALAKDAGVPEEGSGSHRIAIVSDAGAFTDPDGFAWESAGA